MDITEELVQRLVTGQFPQWFHLPIRPVATQGNDNRTFRLGDQLAVRLPSHERYVAGISKEDSFLRAGSGIRPATWSSPGTRNPVIGR